MHRWVHLLVIFSYMIISSVVNSDNPDDLQRCSGGVCVVKDLCPDGMYNTSVEQNLSSPLVGEDYVCRDKEVCCKKVSKSTETPTTSPKNNLVDSGEEIVLPTISCGKFNENGLIYEVHSNESLAQYAEFPWVVYIMTKTNKQSSPADFVCGGTLIHPRFVVTTAHNTDGKSNLIARFGEWDISTKNEPFSHQDINVKEIIKHPDYVHNPIQNDIALLLLEEVVEYKKHIQHICLPQLADQFVGKRCISNGWGEHRGEYANVMKKMKLPVIDHTDCNRMLRSAVLGPYYNLREGFMCAGGEADIDMCQGDGGSPLACQTDSGAFVLAGIVSWGIGCGGHNLPGVYVAVNRYVNWINEHLMKYSPDIDNKLKTGDIKLAE